MNAVLDCLLFQVNLVVPGTAVELVASCAFAFPPLLSGDLVLLTLLSWFPPCSLALCVGLSPCSCCLQLSLWRETIKNYKLGVLLQIF